MLGSRLSDPRGFSCHETQNSLEAPVSHLVLEFAEVSGRGNGRRWGPPWPQRPGSTAAPVRARSRAPSVSRSRCLGARQVSCLSGTEARPSRGPRDGMLSVLDSASRFEAEESEPLYC